MTTLLIDDEQHIREGLKILLKPHTSITVIGEASNITEGKHLINKLKPELVFLDIKLKNSNGFDLLEQLDYKNFKLIFITAFNAYAIKAFKFNAFDYLLKPIDPEELDITLKRLNTETTYFKDQQNLLSNTKNLERLAIKTNEQIYVLDFNDIVRCQSDEGYTFFYLKNNTRIISSKTLKEYNSILPESRFIRVHQSHLVNILYVKKYHKAGHIELKNNVDIPVSIRKRQEITKRLTQN